MEREQFTLFEILKATGMDRERLRGWMKEGYITPSIQKGTGPGRGADTKNLFSRLDLYGIVLFWYMVEKIKLPRFEAAKLVKGWLDDVAYWTAAAGMDDTQIRALLSKCNVMTVTRMAGEYLFRSQEILDDIRKKVLSKYSKDMAAKGVEIPEGMTKELHFSPIHDNLQKLLLEELLNPDVQAPWSWVLHINFAKIRATVDKLFP